jgi:hypothetical protein
MKRRDMRFDNEESQHPGRELAEETREGVRCLLGFFIGETPVDPFESTAAPGAGVVAVATGPSWTAACLVVRV